MRENAETIARAKKLYIKFQARKLLWIYGLAAICVVVSLFSLGMGAYRMTVREVIRTLLFHGRSVSHVVIWNIRLTRILAAVLVGSALAVSGTVMQCVLRNPLSSPYTLGISSAAAFGAAIAIATSYFGWFHGTWIGDTLNSIYGMSLFALIFSMAAVAVVILFSRTALSTPESMVLAGVAMGSIFSAALSSLQYLVDDQTLSAIVYWQFGDLSKATWNELVIAFVIMVPITGYFIYHRMDFNALEAGNEVAKTLGVNTRKITMTSMILGSIMASVCVAMVGIIGFVGLLGPHIMRRVIGSDHRHLLPASMVMGSLVLLCADAVGRIPFESPMPVGIITSFFGGPLFLYMIIRKKIRKI